MWPIPDSMTLSDDHRAVAWVQQGLLPRSRESGYRVGDIVPQGFEAYARIFHPVSRYSSDGREREIVRWSQIASWNGRVAHPAMQLHAILGQTNPSRVKIDWGQEPTDGWLDRAEAATLSEILAEFTTTPQTCFFCIWEGWGWLGGPESFAYLGTAGGVRPQQDDKERAARKRLEEAGRLDVGAFKYLLFTGRLGAPQEMVK